MSRAPFDVAVIGAGAAGMMTTAVAAQRDKLISEAQSKAASILAEAEAKGRDEMARLEAERVTLESRISELRQFERDYRSQLRGFIEDKLRDLDVAGTTSGASPVSAS